MFGCPCSGERYYPFLLRCAADRTHEATVAFGVSGLRCARGEMEIDSIRSWPQPTQMTRAQSHYPTDTTAVAGGVVACGTRWVSSVTPTLLKSVGNCPVPMLRSVAAVSCKKLVGGRGIVSLKPPPGGRSGQLAVLMPAGGSKNVHSWITSQPQ